MTPQAPTKGMSQMPKASQESITGVRDFGVVEDRAGDLGGYTVNFVSIRQDHDLAFPLSGLPGGRCPCPHWGYIVRGRVTVRYADHEEVYEAGDAFYMPPGHIPAAVVGTEIIQFSPSDQLQEVEAAMARQMQQMQGA
jgi:hypothetical protein